MLGKARAVYNTSPLYSQEETEAILQVSWSVPPVNVREAFSPINSGQRNVLE